MEITDTGDSENPLVQLTDDPPVSLSNPQTNNEVQNGNPENGDASTQPTRVVNNAGSMAMPTARRRGIIADETDPLPVDDSLDSEENDTEMPESRLTNIIEEGTSNLAFPVPQSNQQLDTDFYNATGVELRELRRQPELLGAAVLHALNSNLEPESEDEEDDDPDYEPGRQDRVRDSSSNQNPVDLERLVGDISSRDEEAGAHDSDGDTDPDFNFNRRGSEFASSSSGMTRSPEAQSSSAPRSSSFRAAHTSLGRRKTTPRKQKPRKRTKKRRGAKKAKPKASKAPTIRKPPKPLVPKIVYEDLPGNEASRFDALKKAFKECDHKVAINFSEATPTAPTSQSSSSKSIKNEIDTGYKIGELFVAFVGDSSWTVGNRDMLLEIFPGLTEFHIFGKNNDYFIRLRTEEKLSEEESALRPKPKKLTGSDARRALIFVLNRHFFFHIEVVNLNEELLDWKSGGLGCKRFRLDFVGLDDETNMLKLDAKLMESAIIGEHDLDEIPLGRGSSEVLSYFFEENIPPKPLEEEARKKEDTAWFYGQLKKYHSKEALPEPEFSVQPECVIPVLRPYQRNAVRWMLYREGVLGPKLPKPSTSHYNASTTYTKLIQAFLDKMYVSVNLGMGQDGMEIKPAFYNPYAGYVCWSPPKIPGLSSGGVLADEMGLGKTVELICLILLNQKPVSAEEESLKENLVKLEIEENESNINRQTLNSTEPDEYEDIQEETSDEEYIAPVKKGRKRGRLSPRKQSRKRAKVEGKNAPVNSSQTDSHPRLRSRRKISPSEFVSKKKEESDDSDESYSGKVKPTSDDDVDYVNKKTNQDTSDSEEEISKNAKKEKVKGKNLRGRSNLKRSKANPVPGELRHPKLRKRRNVSPCEFTVHNFEENKIPNQDLEVPCTSAAAIEHQNRVASEVPTKRESNNVGATNKPQRRKSTVTEPQTTYEKVKAVYDEVLRGFSETNRARKRFIGTFFDSRIDPKSCFECICGGCNDDDEAWVVTCSVCGSSQHADCVGFDKRLEVRMALQNKIYLCPHCAVLEDPLPAKSTLIITPPTISYQWINEIKKHIKNHYLKILYYKGVAHHGYIPPAKLLEYDLVISNYTVLTAELNYVDLPHSNSEEGRRFRNPKRFMTIPSPLPCVLWWRLCLDEAQMVEGISTKMAMMARRLPAVHKWCVTGTPINEGLQDLFGLFAFLGVKPVSHEYWWERLVQDPFYRKDTSLLYELFGQLIWRNSKSDVLDQLGIPPQTETRRWLSFSPVETHFYKQQYEICANKILGKIARLLQLSSGILDAKLSALDRQTVQSLLLPFLELRQACCHPQMVKGQLISLQKGTLTMEELLAQLVKKTSLQCAQDHRVVVAALNGMAGIHMIKEEWVEASERYREVFQSAEKNKDHFHTDSLKMLHTVENLADLLDRQHDGIPFTLRDDKLRSEAEELKKKYLQKYADRVKAAHNAVAQLTVQTEELLNKFCCEGQSWWAATLIKAARLSKIDDLISRIRDDLIDHTKKTNNVITLANKFNDATGLQHVLIENITQMETLRQEVLAGLEKLQENDPSNFVHAAVCCHLRTKTQLYYKDTEETGYRCDLCRYHDDFLKYESILFKEEKKHKIERTGRKWQQQKLMGVMSSDLTEEEKNLALLKEEEELLESLEHVNVGMSDELRRGTWGDSDTERVMKLINTFARINGLPADVRKDGSTHLQLFEAMKKEFRVLRILWRQIYDQVSAVDELSQATTRLRVRYENEEGPSEIASTSRRKTKNKPKELQSGTIEQNQKIQNIHILERHEVDMKYAQMQLDLDRGKEDLSIHFGQLLYLETLSKNGYGKTGTVNSKDCPICQNQLGQEWSVLRCGHSFCSECVKKMFPNAMHTFLCPLCRHSMKHADVSFVDTRGSEEDRSGGNSTDAPCEKKEIKGSHSTKVEAIVETLLKLQDSHPGEKALIFSSWNGVLEIIEKALEQNGISCILLNQTGKNFQTNLDRFKSREDIQALLMPLTSGSKGLNIIEATHVLLVEPILNLATELQAMGRVHRIGQTKPTYVHRFYVKKTIEEQLFEILRTHDVTSDDEGSLTIADLQSLIRNGQTMNEHSPPEM